MSQLREAGVCNGRTQLLPKVPEWDSIEGAEQKLHHQAGHADTLQRAAAPLPDP